MHFLHRWHADLRMLVQIGSERRGPALLRSGDDERHFLWRASQAAVAILVALAAAAGTWLVATNHRRCPPDPSRMPPASAIALAPAHPGATKSRHYILRGAERRALLRQQRVQAVQRVGFLDRLVDAPAQDSRKAHRNARLVPRRARNSLEAELEHQRRRDAAHRSEFFYRRLADDRVDLFYLFVAQARVRLGEGDQPPAAATFLRPDRERVIGIQARATAVSALRVDEHGVDRHRIDLPFPPGAGLLRPADAVMRVAPLEHEALDAARARLGAQPRVVLPRGQREQRRELQ